MTVQFKITNRKFAVTIRAGRLNELWFDTRNDGTRMVNLFRIGWAERDDCPVKIACLCVMWLSIHVAF